MGVDKGLFNTVIAGLGVCLTYAFGGWDTVTIDRVGKTIKTQRYGLIGYDRNINY